MSVATNIGRKVVSSLNSTVNLFVVCAILLMLAFGGYAQWDAAQVYAAADTQHYAKYKPTLENEGLSFADLQKINPEVFAWLTVYGTHIDYPVVQAKDNLKYLNTDASGQYSLSGSLFLDRENAKDFSDFSSIIYGHHMDKNTMFGEIGRFSGKEYFEARRYGTLYYDGVLHGLEFFAFLHADAYDTTVYHTKFTNAAGRQAYLDLLEGRASNLRSGVTVTADDHLVLLSTCSPTSTNGRDILVGRITDQVPADPFAAEEARNNSGNFVDRISNLWAHLSFWDRILVITPPCLLVLLLLILLYRRSKKKHKDAGPEKEQNLILDEGDK
ncbi:MAG: class B sortase [Coriobacteriia bacterium]|nr:class B sortase [Coriobacteriia bacterium]